MLNDLAGSPHPVVRECILGARLGRSREIAPAVAFLASGDATWMTGETMRHALKDT
jgi:NAD(P)-dependent dehydrogenase (short-subunit alcohol dehydrogenase family)